ncbi:MAG TPA: LPS assembly lipoprotein LptE [Gemmatimonadales bacterium]|nr:LPS assembly lipoprotein LptE [Gemmatimonadales bacterium]
MAVLPFDNLTTEPTLTQQVNNAVKVAMQDRLGLRSAGESTADAIVRGSITRYEPDQPVAYTGTSSGSGNSVNVTQRALQITVNIEIYDQKAAKALWQRNGLIVEANYPPGQESEGRLRALEKLVTDIVDGAQSQW